MLYVYVCLSVSVSLFVYVGNEFRFLFLSIFLCTHTFLLQWVGTIDLVANDEADANVVVAKDANWATQTTAVIEGEGI